MTRGSYDEEQVALILRRSAELQQGRTMSLEELEAVASEAGIDKALVRQAATELEQKRAQPEQPAVAGVFGPTRTVFERAVEGRVGPHAWTDIVAEIRRHMDATEHGHIQEIGSELIWTSKAPRSQSGRDIRVIVTPRNNRTLVRVEERTGGLAGGLYGGLMGGLGGAGLAWILPVCIAVLGMPFLIPFLILAWILGAYWLAQTIYHGVLANRRPQLQALSEGVAEVCRESASGDASGR